MNFRLIFKYLRCQWWHKHAWEKMNGEINGQKWINLEFTGCKICDIWSYKPN